MQIINSNTKETKEIKLIPEMLNLLGCSKDSFKKLIIKMVIRSRKKMKICFLDIRLKRNSKEL